MSQLKSKVSTKQWAIPSLNRWRYQVEFSPVYETSKLTKNGVERLNCHTTHCVRLKHMDYAENNGLYAMCGSQVSQDATFMHEWLHYFVTVVYQSHFKRVGSSYLAKKGLDIDSWVDNIKDGNQPNFFTLFALNVLLEIHTVVHINSDRIWATMDKAPSDHQQLAKMCEYHLVFLGQGCFAELVERQHPLIVVELTDRDIKILELGVLTYDEEKTLNSIIFHGLGFALGLGEPFVKDIEVKKEPQDSGDSDT